MVDKLKTTEKLIDLICAEQGTHDFKKDRDIFDFHHLFKISMLRELDDDLYSHFGISEELEVLIKEKLDQGQCFCDRIRP